MARFDEKGELQGDVRFKDILKDLTNTKKYEATIAACNDAKDPKRNCFNEAHAGALARLKEIDPNLSFEEGMIVKSLTAEEKFRLGISDPNAPLKSANAPGLTAAQKEEMKKFGSCYVNPESCADLLRKDFNSTFNKETKVLTLTKEINNGRVVGRNAQGEYVAGTEMQSRTLTLASVNPVTAPKGKDLFDVWETADWTDVSTQANTVMNDFYTTSLTTDLKSIASATQDINAVKNQNENKFQKEKQDREANDALVRDLVIAYISGGMAGVKGAIKNKVEDQINSSLATAWAKASGADDDQVALLTQAVSFMRGKVAEKKIKSNMAKNNLTNAAGTLVAGGLMFATGGMSSVLMANSPMAAMNAFGGGVSKMMSTVGSAFTGINGIVNATLGQAGLSLGTSLATTTYRGVVGDRAADATLNRMTGPKDRLAEIKANEESIIQSNVTQAVAQSTGLPAEVIGNMITDYKGAKAAKKVRAAVNANPLANIGTQIAGAVGGIIKTAIVATGVPERNIQSALTDGNRLLTAGSRDATLNAQASAYTNQMLGMKAPGTSYTSSTPTLKDKEGLVKELGQRAAVDVLSVGMTKEEKAVLNAAFRKGYGAIEQKKADKKAQSDAIRSTVVTAVTTLATMGVAAAASQTTNVFLKALSTGVKAMGAGNAKLGEAVIRTVVQMADGARNGVNGALAGAANGFFSMVTQGAGQGAPIAQVLRKATATFGLGIGVSYDKQAGWGGMLGIGNAVTNLSVSFSDYGKTSIGGSMASPIEGAQLTINHTLTGDTTVGINYNEDRGPRDGLNLGLNYNTNSGQTSGNISYTMPDNLLGISVNLDQSGMATSTQYNGVNLGTNTVNGFQANEFNWAQENINAAQNLASVAERQSSLDNQSLSNTRDIGSEQIHAVLQENGFFNSSLPGEQIVNLGDGTLRIPPAGAERVYSYEHEEPGFLGFGGRRILTEIDANGHQLNRAVMTSGGFLSNFFGRGNQTFINGTELRDGNGIFRRPNSRMDVMDSTQLVNHLNGAGSNQRYLFSQNGMDNNGMEAIMMNLRGREVTSSQFGNDFGGNIHIYNGTRTVFGDAVNYAASSVLSRIGLGGVENAETSWSDILRTQAMQNQNIIIGHSQGAQIVTNAIVNAENSRNPVSLDNTRLILVGGAHDQIPTSPRVADIRNRNDPVFAASGFFGSLLGRPFFDLRNGNTSNYMRIDQVEGDPRISTDGYLLYEDHPNYNWQNPNSNSEPGTLHSFDQYVPAINHYLNGKEK